MPLAHTSVTVHGLDLLVDYYHYPTGSIELIRVETFSGDDITDMLSDRVWKEVEAKIMEGDDE